jgi:cell division GTPase FtsZ
MRDASAVIFNIVCGDDKFELAEITEATDAMEAMGATSDDCNILYGQAVDSERLAPDEVEITIIATGLSGAKQLADNDFEGIKRQAEQQSKIQSILAGNSGGGAAPAPPPPGPPPAPVAPPDEQPPPPKKRRWLRR